MYKEKVTYRSEIIAALRILGGQGALKDIYKAIEDRNQLPGLNTNENWQNTVRANLQRYSSNSKNYQGKEDLFFSVEGLLSGIWGIRDDSMLDMPDTFDFFADGECKDADTERVFKEGTQKLIVVNAYERNKTLRRSSIEIYGVDCQICEFNFEKCYGIRGRGFIEIHHIVPLSEIKQIYIITPEDLLPVCSNCHSIVHRFKPFLTVSEMKNLYNLHNNN